MENSEDSSGVFLEQTLGGREQNVDAILNLKYIINVKNKFYT